MLLISSNAFKDREREIVSEKAIDNYVKHFIPGAPLLYWHGGDPIGELIHAEKMGAFLVEVAQESPDAQIDLSRMKGESPWITTVKEVWDAIDYSMTHEGIEWGASIGFGYHQGDEEDGIYKDIHKFETSVLPLKYAANILTNLYILKKEANNG